MTLVLVRFAKGHEFSEMIIALPTHPYDSVDNELMTPIAYAARK